jgi:hypothetical protein
MKSKANTYENGCMYLLCDCFIEINDKIPLIVTYLCVCVCVCVVLCCVYVHAHVYVCLCACTRTCIYVLYA